MVGGLEHFLFFHIFGIRIPTDELIFFRGVDSLYLSLITNILHLNPLYHLWPNDVMTVIFIFLNGHTEQFPNDVWCTNVGEVIWIHWTIPIWIQSIINWTSPWNVLTYATFCRTYGHEFDVLWWMCVKQPGPTGLGLGECWGFPQENLQRNI